MYCRDCWNTTSVTHTFSVTHTLSVMCVVSCMYVCCVCVCVFGVVCVLCVVCVCVCACVFVLCVVYSKYVLGFATQFDFWLKKSTSVVAKLAPLGLTGNVSMGHLLRLGQTAAKLAPLARGSSWHPPRKKGSNFFAHGCVVCSSRVCSM